MLIMLEEEIYQVLQVFGHCDFLFNILKLSNILNTKINYYSKVNINCKYK